MRNNPFGRLLKRHRTKRRTTLREFCLSNGFDPGNYSRLERGLFPPPQSDELLEKYATALGLIRGSDVWIELFDVAAASKGELPRDLLDDDQLIEKLPILFRTLRATAVSPDKLDELIDQLRKG